MKLEYFDTPMTANLYLADEFILKGGMQLGILSNAMMRVQERELTYELDVNNGINTVDIGFPIGLSFETSGGFTIDLRYCYSPTEIEQEKLVVGGNTYYNNGNRGHNSVITFTLGYKFDL